MTIQFTTAVSNAQFLFFLSSPHTTSASVTKCFVVRKGAEFSTEVVKQEAELTPEMIQR